VIVVIGSPIHRPGVGGRPPDVIGLAAGIATAAAAAGRDVQLVGRVGADPAGDASLIGLAERRVGHVAVLRDAGRATRSAPATSGDDDATDGAGSDSGALTAPAPSTDAGEGSVVAGTLDAGDLDLALRYLVGFAVVVVAEALPADALAIAAEAAAYTGAALIVLLPPGRRAADVPPDAFVLEAPASDPDGVFARTVGLLAAALDRGDAPEAALASAASAGGWERAAD